MSDKGHHLLAQVPLIKSPIYTAPRSVQLPSNYKPLPQRLPETHVTKDNLEAWLKECKTIQEDLQNYCKAEKDLFANLQDEIAKLAPGYNGGSVLLEPQRKTEIDQSLSTLNIN